MIVELREGFSEGFASLQNSDPGEACLEAFQDEELKKRFISVFRNSPF
jgi:hypothetical protein